MGDAWDSAPREERMLALIFDRAPWWLRAAMRVTVFLPGRLGWFYDRLEAHRQERGLAEYRRRRAERGVRK